MRFEQRFMGTNKLDPWEQLQTLVYFCLVSSESQDWKVNVSLAKCEESVFTGVQINDYTRRCTQTTYGYNLRKTFRGEFHSTEGRNKW